MTKETSLAHIVDSTYELFERAKVRLRPYAYFTALSTVWRHLDPGAQSLLDVGCGPGEPMGFLGRRRKLFSVGVDIFLPYIKECQRRAIHNNYVLADVRCLPFRPQSFDVALCMEVLEHLEEEDGQKLLQELERVARRQVIITTPLGRHEQYAYDGNPYQEHRHIWQPAMMKRLGYTVRGHGLRNLGGLSGRRSPLPRFIRAVIDVAWVLAGPVVYLWPEMGGNMVCIKNLARD